MPNCLLTSNDTHAQRGGRFAIGLVALVLGSAIAHAERAPSGLAGRVVRVRGPVVPLRHQARPIYYVKRAAKPPTIDGDLAEWQHVPAIALEGEEDVRGGIWKDKQDCSGSLRMLWDADRLYFALDVTDDVVNTPKDSDLAWTQDCCQTIFDSLLNGHETSLDERDLSYCASRNSAGPLLCAYQVTGIQADAERKLPDRSIRFRARKGGYAYEWSLPWRRLAPVSPWILGRCGFSFTINDNDGAGFEGALAWTGGAIYGLNALKLGQIVFEGAQGTQDEVLGLPAEFRSSSPYGEHKSSWLELPGTNAFQTARLLVHSTRRRTVAATLNVYARGDAEPLVKSPLEASLRAGETVVCTWDLSGLPKGDYDISYTTSLGTQAEERLRYQQLYDPPLPGVYPSWPAGYRVRYTLRVTSDSSQQPQKTVVASIPTGGWLKPDYGDLVLKTLDGREIPMIVLSHDPQGETLVQFRRHENDQWYFLFASNPAAPPRDTELLARIDKLKRDSQAAALVKMAASRVSAQKAGRLRNLKALVEREQKTFSQATVELAEWNKLLPERVALAATAAAKIPAARQAADAAEQAYAPFGKIADERTAAAAPLVRQAEEARRAVDQARRAQADAVRQAESLEAAARAAADTARAAQTALASAESEASAARKGSDEAAKAASDARERAAKAKGDARAKADKEAAAKATAAASIQQAASAKAAAALAAKKASEAADAQLRAAQKQAEQQMKLLPGLQQALAGAEALAAQKAPPAKAAADLAQAARLAAAPTAAAKAQADAALAQTVAASQASDRAVAEARERIAAATELKRAAEKVLAEERPRLPSIESAAQEARLVAEKATAEATTKEAVYFDYANVSDPRLFKEGLTVEYRQWDGDKLGSWADAVGGLQNSDNILGSALVGEVVQNVNPYRRGDVRNFAASYRGYLRVEQPGIYSFFVNADDAAFLFINGYKIYSRTGSNAPMAGAVKLYSIGADMLLDAGVHPFEVHHIVGNTPGARGLCSLLWLTPGSKQWQFVPREAFGQPLIAKVAGVDAYDGRQIAVFDAAMDDVLTSDGVTLYLARFEAEGRLREPSALKWQFAKTTASDRAVSHIFFRDGDHVVSLKSHPDLPAFTRRCHVWTPAVATNPRSLAKAVDVLAKTDVARLDVAELNDVFHFLSICEQEARWPIVERVCKRLQNEPGLDIRYRATLAAAYLEALARQGRGEKALALVDDALARFGHVPTLRILILLRAANVARDVLRDFAAADRFYSKIALEHQRLRHPLVRQAAIAWGDMFIEGDDLARAAEAFRLARTLGTIGTTLESSDDPVRRGALLRVAEQELRHGNVRQSRRLLRRIEEDFPEQKLEGLYRFLRGEAQRHAGQYDRAIRDYEVVLKLPQWAGYRPSALFGVADSYYRMNDLPKALDWLSDLEESYPEYASQKKLSEYRQELELRLAATSAESKASPGSSRPRRFTQCGTDFELGEFRASTLPAAWECLPRLGFCGPVTIGGHGPLELAAPPLTEVPPEGSLWAELWYRTTLGHPISSTNNIVFSATLRSGRGQTVGEATTLGTCTFGQWHKAAFSLPNPGTRDAQVTLNVNAGYGELELDGFRVWHVSDAENDALRNFLEGADPQ